MGLESRISCQELSEVQKPDACRLVVSVQIPHVFRICCSRFILRCLILFRIENLRRGRWPFPGEGNSSLSSAYLSAWDRSALDAEEHSRRRGIAQIDAAIEK